MRLHGWDPAANRCNQGSLGISTQSILRSDTYVGFHVKCLYVCPILIKISMDQ